jgi:hypothetical protein
VAAVDRIDTYVVGETPRGVKPGRGRLEKRDLAEMHHSGVLAVQQDIVRVLAPVHGDYNSRVSRQWLIVLLLENERVSADLGNVEHSAFEFEAYLHLRRIAGFVIDHYEKVLTQATRSGIRLFPRDVNLS